jgi:hypothetical protein
MVCAFFTWGLILYAEFVVLRVILLPDFPSFYSVVNLLLFQCFAILALSSHLRTMLTDPVRQTAIDFRELQSQDVKFEEFTIDFEKSGN